MPRIKGIKIQNLFGLTEMVIEVPENSAGIIFQGDNGLGKTSALRAIQAALVGRGIDATSIRRGSSKGQVVVDLDNYSVRRVLGQGERLEVNTADGFSAGKPAALLKQMLGTSSLDPLDLLLEKDAKKRQKAVLAACPAQITPEELKKWWPKCPDDYPCEGHALEVVERVRKAAYDKRTTANRTAKETTAEASRLAAEAITAERAAPKEEPDVLALEAVVEAAKAGLAALQSRHEQAASQGRKTEAQRARVNALRSQAVALVAGAEDPSAVLEIEKEQRKVRMAAQEEVTRLQAALDAAIEVRNREQDALDDVCSRRVRAVKATTDAAQLQQQADEIEAVLAQAAVEPVTDEDLEMARRSEEYSTRDLEAARQGAAFYRKALSAAQAASEAQAAADAAKAEADRLDAIVKALTEDAPAEILARSQGIPGLTIAGDDIFLDGVSLETCCGAERIRFAVQVAKRANAKSKILIVDELERLSAKNFELFVQEATADGWELYGTRVSDDDHIVMVPIKRAAINDQAAE